jgi:hypothetical protein
LRHGLVNRSGDTYTVRLSQLFDPLREHYACAGYGVVGDHHFTEADADAKLRSYVVVECGVEPGILGLECKCRGNCVRCPVKFGDQGVTAYFPRHTTVTIDGGGETLEGISHALVGERFAALDEFGGSDYVSVQYDSELS